MSGRGASKWKPGDEIFLLETIFGDGSSKYKIFPNLQGFRASVRAVQKDVLAHRSYNQPWATKSYRTYVMPKTEWEDFNG